MTASTEARASQGPRANPFQGDWRTAAADAQAAAMPSGSAVVTCSARRGVGGLGRHLDEIASTLEGAGEPTICICGPEREQRPRRPSPGRVLRASPIPVSQGLRARAFMVDFDAHAARRLPDAEHLIAFNGQALAQLRAGRRAGYQSLGLVSANSHIRRLARQHARAHRQYPLEGSWARHLVRRNLAEYAAAQRIYVASSYVRESFVEHGFDERLLCDFPLTPDPRFEPSVQPASSGRFEIVYVGSLAVHKGVPLLVDAVRALPYGDLRLTLVGGWATRGMRRFVQSACAADARIAVGPGDPLPALRGANLCVHPAYEDGFAYAPAEALACGVPAIVSEDTGMKDLIGSQDMGLILPTGDLSALVAAIDAAYRREILPGRGADR